MWWILFIGMTVGAVVVATVVTRLGGGSSKGDVGEQALSDTIKKMKGVIFVPSLLLPAGSGTTEIDGVMISRYGVFVFEVKNRDGRFVGSAEAQEWIQYLGTKQHTIYNPLRQNDGHVRAVEAALKGIVNPMNIYSIVVFSGMAAIETNAQNVVKLRDLALYLGHFKVPALADDEIKGAAKRLEAMNNRSRLARAAHIQRIKQDYGSS